MPKSSDDVRALRRALKRVESRAKALPWAAERPWRVRSHVGWSAGAPTIDLHDLNARLAREVADALTVAGPSLKAGAVFLVVGRGRHSRGKPVLGGVVRAALMPICDELGWEIRSPKAGRLVLILDGDRAPAAVTGRLGWGFWAWVLVVLGAALAPCLAGL